jgi:biotin carboxyl carrier protein
MEQTNNDIISKYTKNKNEIFSTEALNKMRSPEKLDTVLPITDSISWMGLISIGVLVFSIILWSIYGSFTVKVDGMGLIIDSKGIVNITSAYGGKLDKLYTYPGKSIKAGEPIAHIIQAQETAVTRMAKYGTELSTNDRDVLNRVHEYDMRRHQENAAEFIYSDYDGIVNEVLVDEGSNLSGGMPICSIRLTGTAKDLKGVLYVPVEKGKRIKPGMTIQLAPNGVDTSQSGSLLGTVRAVSEYPVSNQAIQKRLGIDSLSQWIISSQQSALMEVSFDLVKDPVSKSGYLWTSSIGKHPLVTAGSFCKGSIIIERRPPIEKVFYKLSQWLRTR